MKSILKIDEDGDRNWYNKDGELHRTDGPACEDIEGYKEWHLNGQLHRENGPAVDWGNGDRYWYLNGVQYTEDEYNVRCSLFANRKQSAQNGVA